MQKQRRICAFPACLTALLLCAFAGGCGNASPALSGAPFVTLTAPILTAPAKAIKTVFLCRVKEEPQKNLGGFPHEVQQPGQPVVCTYRMMSPVTIENVYMGSVQAEYFMLGYVDGDSRYSMVAGEKYLVLMTEVSPFEAFMGYDGVYLLQNVTLKLISGTGIPPSIDGLTLEEALSELDIENN